MSSSKKKKKNKSRSSPKQVAKYKTYVGKNTEWVQMALEHATSRHRDMTGLGTLSWLQNLDGRKRYKGSCVSRMNGVRTDLRTGCEDTNRITQLQGRFHWKAFIIPVTNFKTVCGVWRGSNGRVTGSAAAASHVKSGDRNATLTVYWIKVTVSLQFITLTGPTHTATDVLRHYARC